MPRIACALPFAWLLAAIVAVAFGSCGPPLPASLQLSWSFADGRRCADAGVEYVAVGPDGTGALGCTPATCIFPCTDGTDGQNVTLSLAALGQPHLLLQGRSAEADVLYVGKLTITAPTADVVLDFTDTGN